MISPSPTNGSPAFFSTNMKAETMTNAMLSSIWCTSYDSIAFFFNKGPGPHASSDGGFLTCLPHGPLIFVASSSRQTGLKC